LGNIPGIGRLFSTTAENVNNTETVVIITPRIVRNPGHADTAGAQASTEIDHNLGLIQDHEQQLRSRNLLDKLGTADAH
jgi:type II secretory pathway component GspD/PulD (secretin)